MSTTEERDQPESPDQTWEAQATPGIPALSVQATAIIRAIDAFGAISWWSFGGMALSLLFAGLVRLQRDITLDYVYIGEYQVPTGFLPHIGVAFGIFIQWMLVTRVLHICRLFESSTLPVPVIRDMVRLNPPMINLLESSRPGQVMTGLGVFVAVWAVFYGNLMGLIGFLSVGRLTTIGMDNAAGPTVFFLMLAFNIYFGIRQLGPALQELHQLLYSEPIRYGIRRIAIGGALLVLAVGYHLDPLFSDMTEQDNGLLGPVVANAVDGDTLFVQGWEVDLLGVDALERNQTCLMASGEVFNCGEEATAHMQSLVQDTPVLCWPLVSAGQRSVAALCLLDEGQPLPTDGGGDFVTPELRDHSLARRLVRDGYAVPTGAGPGDYWSELETAQTARRGMWRASVQPPWVYRRRGGDTD